MAANRQHALKSFGPKSETEAAARLDANRRGMAGAGGLIARARWAGCSPTGWRSSRSGWSGPRVATLPWPPRPAASARPLLWLGPPPGPAPTDLATRVDAEVARLRLRAGSRGELAAALDAGRHQAGLIAGFNPSLVAMQARLHEAAVKRGIYRGPRAIAEIRRDQARELASAPPQGGTTPATQTTDSVPPRPAGPPTASDRRCCPRPFRPGKLISSIAAGRSVASICLTSFAIRAG